MNPEKALTSASQRYPLKVILEVFLVFLKIGFTAFGGPVAHISIMQDEFVRRRKWLSDQKFLDLMGATNLIPGPNSTEMSIHIGFMRAGWAGLVVGGLGFLLPSTVIVLFFSWVYKNYGTTPQLNWVLYGVKPVILAIIFQALYALGKKAFKNGILAAVFFAGLAGYFLKVNELIILFGGGLLAVLIQKFKWPPRNTQLLTFFLPLTFSAIPLLQTPVFNYQTLFLSFLKIGSVLYGSGYVLFAFIQTEFVQRLGWISEKMLLDAIAIGQVTPGPVSTSATFIGYQLGGMQGALIATLGIFLPAFFFVAISSPLIPIMRKSNWFSALLDGVNVSSLSLMAGVTWQIGQAAVTDWVSAGLALISLVLVFRFKINSTWIVLMGAVVGIIHGLLV